MTVIIAITDGRKVYMGSDSYCGSSDFLDLCKDPKIELVKKKALIGLAGDVRAETHLRVALRDLLSEHRVTDSFLKEELPGLLYNHLAGSGVLRDKDGVTSIEAEAIIGHAGRLYYVEESLAVWESRLSYTAIGAARQLALGALSLAWGTCDGSEVVGRVLEVVAKHSPWVLPPYDILYL